MNRKIIKQYNDSARKMRSFFYYYSYFEAYLQGRNEVRLLNRAADALLPDPQLGDVIPFPPRSFAWGIRLPSFISANRPCLFLSAAPHWRPELITEGGAMVLGSGICWFSSVSGSSGLEMGFGGPGESQRRGI